jgi:hypothetical protein
MTKKWSQLVILVVSLLVVAVSAGAIAASADDGDDGDERGLGRHGIVGTWQATVNRGPALPPVKSLHVFTKDGTMIESGNDTLYRSPAYGVWKYVGNRTYATTMVVHRFSPTGAYLGTHKINANRQLSPEGDSYNGAAVGELRDPDGNLIASLPLASVVATRMQLERISNQP